MVAWTAPLSSPVLYSALKQKEVPCSCNRPCRIQLSGLRKACSNRKLFLFLVPLLRVRHDERLRRAREFQVAGVFLGEHLGGQHATVISAFRYVPATSEVKIGGMRRGLVRARGTDEVGKRLRGFQCSISNGFRRRHS